VSLESLPASLYIAIFAINPVFVLLWDRRKVRGNVANGVGITLLGTALLIGHLGLGELASPYALVSLLLGMLGWSAYTLLIEKLQLHYGDTDITVATQVLLLLGTGLWWAAESAPSAPLTREVLLIALAFGVTSPAAFFCFSHSLRHTRAFALTSQYLEPAIGIALSCIILRERLDQMQLGGSALILLGVGLVAHAERPRKIPAPAEQAEHADLG
jgi:drug/metabolite transporter (DMT)-like permease